MSLGMLIKSTITALAAVFLGPLILFGADEYRTFSGSNGNEIQAVIVESQDENSVTIRRKDGQIFRDVPVSSFSEADRAYIKKWRKAERARFDDADLKSSHRLEISVRRGVDDEHNSYGDIDDRIVLFEPQVRIKNDEIRYSFKGVKGTLVIVGRGYLRDEEHVLLSRQDFSLDLPRKELASWGGTKFECRYDPDYGGFDYGGYLVVLRNKAGEIVYSKGSRSSWEKNPELLLKAQKMFGYDRNFENGEMLVNTFGLTQ